MKRKTNEEFIEELKNINKNIVPLEEYITGHTSISFECKKCGLKWKARPYSILAGHGCPKCAGKYKMTHDEFISRLSDITDDIEVLSTFVNTTTPVQVKCRKCGNQWNAYPGHLLNRIGCQQCYFKRIGDNMRLSHDDFIKRLDIINKDIIVLSKYQLANKKIKCECKKCHFIWEALPCNLLSNHGCPVCNESKGEKKIFEYLKSKQILFEYQKEYMDLIGINNGLLSYDFYLPTYNMLIEFQGKQHEIPVDFKGLGYEYAYDQYLKQVEHDKRKRRYAFDNRIDLLEIWYFDYDKINKILDDVLFKKR